jgi:hypothetical protein
MSTNRVPAPVGVVIFLLLWLFTKTEVHLPGQTAALAAGRVGEVQSLLQDCRRERPELWWMLIANIDKGISSRQQRDHDSAP